MAEKAALEPGDEREAVGCGAGNGPGGEVLVVEGGVG